MSLTPREQEVATLVARGLSYKSVGAELGISVKTVQAHVIEAASRLPGRGSPKVKLMIFVLDIPKDGR